MSGVAAAAAAAHCCWVSVGRQVQWNRLHSGGLGIPERMGWNPAGYGLSGDWASTRGNGSQEGGGLSDRGCPCERSRKHEVESSAEICA